MGGSGGVIQGWTLSTAFLEAERTNQKPNLRERCVYNCAEEVGDGC